MRLIDALTKDKIVNKRAKQLPVIVGDESLVFIEQSPGKKWLNHDFPCVAPPFQKFWIEARSSLADISMGAFLSSIDTEKSHVNTRLHALEIRDKIQPYSEQKLADPKWYMMLFPFARIKKDYVVSNNFGIFLIDEHGGIINPNMDVIIRENHVEEFGFNFPASVKRMDAQDFQKKHPALSFKDFYPFVMRTLAMVNCVNVELIEIKPNAGMSKRHAKKYHVPLSTWYEYRVKGSKYAGEEMSSDEDRNESGDRRKYREHMVRGHFKRRKSGVFWWSDFVRGHKELGTIQKTYLPNKG